MKELKGELSGKLCTAVMAMGEPSDEYDASELRKVSINSKYYNTTQWQIRDVPEGRQLPNWVC